jgi:hypothetical protein
MNWPLLAVVASLAAAMEILAHVHGTGLPH